jgi:hypothetical protein
MTFLSWYQLKLLVEHASGISMDALHVLIGFLLFLLVARMMRRAIDSPAPWVALLLIELANEAYDLHVELWPNLASQLGEGVKDILLTMALPTLLLIIARSRPDWLARPRGQPADKD